MREFKASRVLASLMAVGVVAFGADVLAQGKGRGGKEHRGGQVERANRGGGDNPGRGHQAQPQPVQQNRGNDRAQMQQRMQQIQQQRIQQAQQQHIPQNRGQDRRAEMQQRIQLMQQQRMQHAQQQRIPQNRGQDRRAEMQQRIQQMQQQRMQQAQQQRIPQNRGQDRRAEMQQRIQLMQQQRMQRAQLRGQQNRGHDRRAEMQQRIQLMQQQRMQQAQQRGHQNRGQDRRAQMQQERLQRMQQRQAERGQARQNRGADRRAEVQQRMQQIQQQRQQQAQQWSGRDRRHDRPGQARERQANIQPQIIPQAKSRDWFPQSMYGSRVREGRRDRGERVRGDSYVQSQSPMYSGVWPQNYGQQRRAEVHQRNAERRAWRESSRSSWSSTPTVFWQQRTYAPTYRPRTFFDNYVYATQYQEPYSYRSDSYSQNRGYRPYGGDAYGYYDQGYTEPYYDYNDYDRPDAADIFRNVIFAVLGGGIPDYGQEAYYESDYAPYYNDGYPSQYVGYEGGGYPAGYSYATDPSYYDPYFYEDPVYADVLPIQYFVADQPGTGLFRQMFTHLLAIGYDQGYQDGVAAMRIRERDRVFYDPYAYDNVSYDPYSVSLGDNRRCLSQGYELGYQDAVNEIDGYDQFEDGGVDLVSLLIGTVSQLI